MIRGGHDKRGMAMARKRARRTTYIPLAGKSGAKTRAQLREYAKLKPSLQKLSKKAARTGKLTSAEYGQFTRARHQLKHTQNLRPITAKQAKLLRKQGPAEMIVGHGIRAIRLRNTAPNAKIKILKSGLIVTSNGRTWEYHPVSANIDKLADYGLALLERKDTDFISLWTSRGRTNKTFSRPEAWVAYIHGKFMLDSPPLGGGKDTELDMSEWVYGIARAVK